jgi:DNA polymerase III psi subunit
VDFSQLPRKVGALFTRRPSTRRLFCRKAEKSVLTTLLEEEEQDSRLDLYLPYSYFIDVVRAVIPAMVDLGIDKHIAKDAHRVSKLVSTELPHLKSLSPQDIVTLRQDEETFQMWRVGLARALDRIHDPDTELFDQNAEARRILWDEVFELSVRTNEKVQKSSFLRELASGGQTFALGAMGAFGSGALGLSNPVAGLVSGGTTAAAGLLLKYLTREPNQATSALQRHFAVLEP